MSTLESVVTLVGLAVVTLVSRAFFVIPEREVPMPA
jgi:branched-subunit amino acid transport protein